MAETPPELQSRYEKLREYLIYTYPNLCLSPKLQADTIASIYQTIFDLMTGQNALDFYRDFGPTEEFILIILAFLKHDNQIKVIGN
ncbi:MAG: hypothetical protein ACRYGG_14810 [Janthinobacterium lividum]